MNIIKTVKYNLRNILKFACKTAIMLFTMLSFLLLFFTWDDIEYYGLPGKLFFLIIIIFGSVIFSILWICVIKKETILYEIGDKKICCRYGDILKFGFSKGKKHKNIVVIPVNSAFDTIVDKNIEVNKKSLVSPETIHGRWLMKMSLIGKNITLIDREINNYLIKEKKIKVFKRKEKENGNLNNYQIGTIVPICGINNTTFLLVALSEFDKNNNSHSSKNYVIKCLKSILKYYYKNGQGYKLFIPLMGTGLSEAKLSPKDSLRITKAFFELHAEKVRGNVNIIINPKHKNQVSIFD